MNFLLLTGAGFTRNWGGWLAKEVEGDLLGRLQEDVPLRVLVQHSRGFESALEELQLQAAGGNEEARARYGRLQAAVAASFQAMNQALSVRRGLEMSSERYTHSPAVFLAKFDAIYTLNQDLLLEMHYDPVAQGSRRWLGTQYPGIGEISQQKLTKRERADQKRQVLGKIELQEGRQPIYKLHGSVDWQDESGDLFVVGGGKAAYIERKPILSAYFASLREKLSEPDTRLMIIGYGFADQHVNDVLTDAAKSNPSLGVFYVHPDGRDAIHQGVPPTLPQYVPPLGYLSCIGESRRPLTTTFSGDELEREKLMRFFDSPPRRVG